jgi:hypothetical protein
MHNLINHFQTILFIVKRALKYSLDEQGNVHRSGRKPKFSDAEIIALAILAEINILTSEHYFMKKLHKNHKKELPNLIDRSNFNRRKKLLIHFVEQLRQFLVIRLTEGENVFIIDSMPLPICKFSRAKRIRIYKQSYETAPEFGYCAAQNETFYGYKLHLVTSTNGVITHFDLTKANFADIHFLKDIKSHYGGSTILGDRAYLSDHMQTELFENNNLLANTPYRINQKNYMKQPTIFRKTRKRIETIFSQLCDYLSVQKNYAKTFEGFMTRILAKITSFTLIQFLNKTSLNRNLCHVKHALL